MGVVLCLVEVISWRIQFHGEVGICRKQFVVCLFVSVELGFDSVVQLLDLPFTDNSYLLLPLFSSTLS